MTESACDEVGSPCVLSTIPYMSEWDTYAWWPKFASRFGISFPYPTGTSKIWYIGKSSEDRGWPRNRAFNHFFGPDADYSTTVFTTKRASNLYPQVSAHENLVLPVEGLGSTEATDELEAKLLKSFKAVHRSVPMCNSQSASSRLF